MKQHWGWVEKKRLFEVRTKHVRLRRIYTRSTGAEVFLRKAVLKICSKVTREHPCRSEISHFGMVVLL